MDLSKFFTLHFSIWVNRARELFNVGIQVLPVYQPSSADLESLAGLGLQLDDGGTDGGGGADGGGAGDGGVCGDEDGGGGGGGGWVDW
ncbi:hypothetical protein M0804_012752 [Polistes exclamans]|nr:hypothetical protein M0804_012752 [Polistes exclamans]